MFNVNYFSVLLKMSDRKSGSKRRKLAKSESGNFSNRREDRRNNELAIVDLYREQPVQMFPLNIDCFDEIFDYLSLKDLHHFAQTCSAMQKVCGEYFKFNFFANDYYRIEGDGIYTTYSSQSGAFNECIRISAFSQFIMQLEHYMDTFEPLYYINSHIDQYSSLKQIGFSCINLNGPEYECIQELLAKVEIVQIWICALDGDFYDCLKFCRNLKHFSIRYCDIVCSQMLEDGVRTLQYPWLTQEYPKLEHLELIPFKKLQIDELSMFFACNSHVQSFSTSGQCLWVNRNVLLKSAAHLDKLEIRMIEVKMAPTDEFGVPETRMQAICTLVNQLHEHGFFRRLHFYINDDEQIPSIDELASVAGLEKLCIRKFKKDYSLVPLTNVRELVIWEGAKNIDLEALANKCVKLERLYFGSHTIDHLLPFIRRSAKLNKVKAFSKIKTNFSIAISNLNAQREKLAGAHKLIIYVPDNIFLATKWTARNGDVNLSLVELRRGDSYEFTIS
ncbi:uncharacterized protein LOC129570787 [Sitodiplosis mosellana]|uniref:uncharacterized protein LOC129570787 n=1 Tax=Sitodiplosis mosellana TaxID=263140 RepID=UPI002444A208|nr:uncharacterized protein LOC129570787 [Sitodiplosis mosellana]